MSSWKRLAALVLVSFAGASVAKETLYATSLRSHVEGTSDIAGNLYAVDPSTATATLVGAIKVEGTPVGVVALATHPRTGKVYGITAGMSPAIPRSLLEIDLDSATARLIARLPARGSDIGFDNDGVLYMWAPDLHQLVSVDLETANLHPIGSAVPTATNSAVAISVDGREALVAANGSQLLRIDIRTGALTKGVQLRGLPYDASIDNLTFSPSGVLYAVNSDGGAPSRAALIVIDPSTGNVQKIGVLPDDVRGLIFATERSSYLASRQSLRPWILAVLGVAAAGLIAFAVTRS